VATQLRDYLIAPGHLDDFVDAWTRGVRPLRERFGFTIGGAWVAVGEERFVWLLSFRGTREEFEERDAAYYASAGRAAVDPDPAQWIVESGTVFVEELTAEGDT
jgi:hypothetical protein